MAHPQSSPRGLWAKDRLDIGGQELTYDSTNKGLVFKNAVNTLASALPGDARNASPVIVPISNSTGQCFAMNVTGTSWTFIAGTSVQPT